MIMFRFLGEWGRLGNQLFQYSTLFAIAKKNGYEIGVPLHHKKENPYMNFYLDDCFEDLNVKPCLNQRCDYEYFEPYPNTKFNPQVLDLPDHTNIHGYFQSEKYFKDYRKDLLKQLTFKKDISDTAKRYRDCISEDCISVHVRMGDYFRFPNKHPICNYDYYQQAFDMMPKDIPIILFSDSLEHAIQLIKPFNKKMFIFDTKNDFVELCLMSMCNYHIIANSSFSWWGSWLSKSKKTVAPSQWFGPDEDMPKNWDDIYCEGWSII